MKKYFQVVKKAGEMTLRKEEIGWNIEEPVKPMCLQENQQGRNNLDMTFKNQKESTVLRPFNH